MWFSSLGTSKKWFSWLRNLDKSGGECAEKEEEILREEDKEEYDDDFKEKYEKIGTRIREKGNSELCIETDEEQRLSTSAS